MATNTKQKKDHQDPEVKIENAIDKTESFLVKNGKVLLSVLAVVIVVIGIFMYIRYVHGPKQAEKASEMMFVAEQHFASEDYALALEGDGNNPGFLEVIDRYGKTPQGNIARHYAGICYLNMGDKQQALNYLEKYDRTEGAPNKIVNALNLGLQGDLYSDQGNYETAADRYRKAVDAANNNFTSPMYLKKLGLVYMELGRNEQAAESFQRISDEFGQSIEARDIDKFIGAAQQL